MSTKNLFVELFVIGIGAIIWIFLLILTIFGYGWLNKEFFQSWNILIPLITLPLIALIYVIGIIVDRIADSSLVKIDVKKREEEFKKAEEDYHYVRTYLFYKSNKFKEIFDYSRGKLRVSRSWIFNFILIGLTMMFFVWIRLSEYPFILKFKISTFGLVTAILLANGSRYTWSILTKNYYGRILHAYEVVRKIEKDEAKNKQSYNN